jgi:hypothetical protein
MYVSSTEVEELEDLHDVFDDRLACGENASRALKSYERLVIGPLCRKEDAVSVAAPLGGAAEEILFMMKGMVINWIAD